jgi:hypothetical protein
MQSLRVRLMLVAGWLFICGTGQAALLQVSGGMLTGATGVLVNGVAHDVVFVDGSCIAVFGGCDDASDFHFSTADDAQAASEALLAQVFVDLNANDAFDSAPGNTSGCGDPQCWALTPYGIDSSATEALGFIAANEEDETLDLVMSTSFLPTDDWGNSPGFVFAVWSAPGTIPEPNVLALLCGTALAMMAAKRRRSMTLGTLRLPGTGNKVRQS